MIECFILIFIVVSVATILFYAIKIPYNALVESRKRGGLHFLKWQPSPKYTIKENKDGTFSVKFSYLYFVHIPAVLVGGDSDSYHWIEEHVLNNPFNDNLMKEHFFEERNDVVWAIKANSVYWGIENPNIVVKGKARDSDISRFFRNSF